MASIVVLVGNPQPASRTRRVAEEIAAQLAEGTDAVIQPTIDLADVAGRLFTFPDAEVDALLERVAAADVLVVASPTYKAAYTGLLKAFLDRYGSNGLAGVTAVPVLTIGAPIHALAVEHILRPLLVELGASVPTRGIAFPAADVERRAEIVATWVAAEASRLAPALTAAR
ncbi:NADPH-dependent FMN reductase [Microbacterium sp. CJ88]|uniref:NADPH-dependent FMN reductase n=1 Tax=Microbacterium sp. CJ88 TaxID=3445672 RepID=UPI003F65DA75